MWVSNTTHCCCLCTLLLHSCSNQNESCPGSLWVSTKRYVWFDLTANLTFYGPGPGGKGQVFAHSTPLLKHYKQHYMHRAIVPDLAALVWSACQVKVLLSCYFVMTHVISVISRSESVAYCMKEQLCMAAGGAQGLVLIRLCWWVPA